MNKNQPANSIRIMLHHRQLAYDDFIAVAEDLIARGITAPKHLGVRGRSL